MGAVSITGSDSLQLDSRLITDFSLGDISKFTFPNDLGMMKVSKNQNAIYAQNPTGMVTELEMRLIRGSADDKYVNSRLQEWINDPAGFILLTCVFVKRVGDGQGNLTSDVYQMSGGIFKKVPEAKSNVEGDTEQSEVVYSMMLKLNSRSLQ